jgi:phosphoserine aminotransferase
MRNVFNFSAGPAMVPEAVLRQAQAEMLDWQGTGMSIMEIGHRTPEFQAIAQQAETDLRELMAIPSHYHVLFLSGGATTQFAMVPLNLFGEKKQADYIDTGIWSKKAIAEASRYGIVNVAASAEERDQLVYIPSENEWNRSADAAYLHYTPNETIAGLAFPFVPDTGDVPLVADMTSVILSRPVDVTRFGLIYAGTQKNLGHAGMNVVIIRDDLLKESLPSTPTLYQYKIQAEHHGFYNTPPTYCWYMAGLVLAWMKQQGGVDAISAINQRKAEKIYSLIDQYSGFYVSRVESSCRSLVNVMFYLGDESLTATFLEEAQKLGLLNLRGHRVSGGVRASMYNAMPEEGADRLATFMVDFVRRYG